jgi:hypothetical protein
VRLDVRQGKSYTRSYAVHFSLLAEHILEICLLAARIPGHTKLQKIPGNMEKIHLLRISHFAVPASATSGSIKLTLMTNEVKKMQYLLYLVGQL